MNKIKHIVIVGAGSSGYITASFLKKTFSDLKISVIESPDHPVIGVGESTLPDFTNYRDYLELDEIEFMKATDASYKMGIKFTDFYDVDSGHFFYPFRMPDLSNTKYGLHDWLEIKAFYPDIDVKDFVRCYFPQMALMENNKYDLNDFGFYGSYNPHTDVAYHFDAVKFGIYLRDFHCVPQGVEVISAFVENVILDDNGIKKLILNTKQEIEADLFIDCTGFKSLLLGDYMKIPFKSYSDMLPNNRAWATQLPYKDKEKELECVTNGTAIQNGWVWNIPLWSRLGSGYVFSDKYISKEDALDEFKTYLMSNKMIVPRTKEEVDALSFKDIPMRVGIHEKVWVKNVVAIGLSAGFIEPLQSNGLFTVFWFVRRLAKTLLRGQVSQFDRDVFNYSAREVYDTFAEFVASSYALSLRNDSLYWQNIQTRNFSKDLSEYLQTNRQGFVKIHGQKMINANMRPEDGLSYMSVGMNYLFFDRVDQKMNVSGANIKSYIDNNKHLFEVKKKHWKEVASRALSLHDYLKTNVYEKETKQ